MNFNDDDIGNALITLIQLVCDYPEQVSFNVHHSESSIIFEIVVNEGDYGKVIGKQGKTAQALRTVMRAIAGRFDKRLILEFSPK